MQRFRMTIEYDGSRFVGWQAQNNGISVQRVLEEAVFRFSGQSVRLHAAGRTDAGVHALAQVAHVDLEGEISPDSLRDAVNFHVRPHKVAVRAAEMVADDFHARFSAIERAYLYRILNRKAPPALDWDRVWWVPKAMDVDSMRAAAARLVGNHDFTSFRASICQASSPVRTLDELDVERQGDEIHIRARARSFLHHQVRNLVGTLSLVGKGQWTPDDVSAAMEARDRARGGPTAPPQGLYLTCVGY